MASIRERYGEYFKQMATMSHAAAKIDATNVYQKANPQTKKIMDTLISENMAEGSRLEGIENFKQFLAAIKSGKSGLILMEHYANTDLPGLIWLLENSDDEDCRELGKRVVAIAGMKLNEADPMVRAFAESFTRVVIYPTRSLDSASEKAKSKEDIEAETKKARAINLAAMHAMDKCKRNGEAILVFPSGTRYRPGKPETKRGLKEIDSYLRMFDVMILVSINGMILKFNPDNMSDMLADECAPAVCVYKASPVIECKPYRKEFLETLPADCPDPKQAMIDHVMEYLEKQHNEIKD
ncbi:1-acyl-sn-glycerol-3-phosphate acyltransferase [Treponema pectinovorum]|uniref:1-acyl-sn-glycerol-3-phosphate acyltransferase n=1 Tax=Treponema pectinovorum TaxID=164 RepID=UPI0011CA4613|nr:1-acyl-sn-glycerol-3-phosphate acyltransferase [Treponema pectinovorum]